GGGDRQHVAGDEGGGGGHREARGRCAGGEGHRADRADVVLDREGGGRGGGGRGGAVAAGEPRGKGDGGRKDVALDDLRGGGAAGERARHIGRALDRAAAGQAVAGRGQPGETLQALAEDVEGR